MIYRLFCSFPLIHPLPLGSRSLSRSELLPLLLRGDPGHDICERVLHDACRRNLWREERPFLLVQLEVRDLQNICVGRYQRSLSGRVPVEMLTPRLTIDRRSVDPTEQGVLVLQLIRPVCSFGIERESKPLSTDCNSRTSGKSSHTPRVMNH